ncbi:MAG TPA: ATP-binding cassette domain-containing protein [Actinoplanes sp.]|nr:ATP-binding cassette domain-containing protein [Actinoplanes sp.]
MSELTVSGPAGPLVRGIGFDVAAGERVAVVGASGSGKSLTAKALLGALPAGLTVTGGIRIGGVEVRNVPCDRRAAGQRLGFVPQDTFLALHPLIAVGDQVALALRPTGEQAVSPSGAAGMRAASRRGVAGEQATAPRTTGRLRWWGAERRAAAGRRRERVAELLEAVGLPDAEGIVGRHPGELSGGQRQRICLAIALASRPPLVIADEPTTALDMITQDGIVRLLRERTGNSGDAGPGDEGGRAGEAGQDRAAGRGVEAGPGLLFITHDLAVAAALCERVIVMDDGVIVEDGAVGAVIAGGSHPRTRALVEAARRASKALEGLR